MRLTPLATRIDYPGMVARATISVDEKQGGGSFELVGSGYMAFSLTMSDDPSLMDVLVEDLVINFGSTGITLPEKDLQLPPFTINKCHLDLSQTRGRWYRDGSRLELQLAIRLDPRHFPFMYDFGYGSPVTLLVMESGTLAWGARHLLDTHAEPFVLPPPLDFLTVSPGQFCDVRAELGVAIDCELGRDINDTEVWICPGDTACLIWETANATSVTLTPGGSVGASGTQVVSPTTTQTYILNADNECKVKRQVTVRVVRAGETTNTLSASWDAWRPSSCIWRLEVPEALVSDSVMVQELRHVKCSGGTLTHPEWAYRHTDPNGALFTGNVRLDAWTDIPDQPLAGQWEFSPLGIDHCRPPEGANGWEPACFDARLGCR